MTTWEQFAFTKPDLAAFGQQRLQGRIAYLATLRVDGAPRLHPVSPFIAQGYLFVYMEPTSPKGHDLRRDARYALHCSVEDNRGGNGEFLIQGYGVEIDNPDLRSLAFKQAKAIGYNPQERYILFELSVEEVLSIVYQDGHPVRMRWKAS